MTIPCFFIIVLVCIGLKETAVALADPFGGDDVDFETEVSHARRTPMQTPMHPYICIWRSSCLCMRTCTPFGMRMRMHASLGPSGVLGSARRRCSSRLQSQVVDPHDPPSLPDTHIAQPRALLTLTTHPPSPPLLQNYMAAMLANTKAMISPSADYSPQLLPIMAKKK